MIIVNIFMSLILLLVIPFCMGLLVINKLNQSMQTFGLILPVGYLLELVTFELVTVPILLLTKYQNFRYVIWIYTPIMLALAIWGALSVRKKHSSMKSFLATSLEGYKITDPDAKVMWILVLVLLVGILIMAQTRVFFDGDDAFYVTQSLITSQNGTMYSIQPYTGRAAVVDIRHAMAVFTIWISYISKLSGIHSTIVCHSVLPMLIIPLCFMTFGEVGIRLLGNKKEMLPYFCVFVELLFVFGRISIYTAETFLLTRTWQGKALAANFLIPMTFLALYAFISATQDTRERWLMLLLVNGVAGIFSSLAIVLVSILILAGGFVFSIYKRRIKYFIISGCCCIPGGIYMILYLYFTYFGWR